MSDTRVRATREYPRLAATSPNQPLKVNYPEDEVTTIFVEEKQSRPSSVKF